jgi:hypothetical protein
MARYFLWFTAPLMLGVVLLGTLLAVGTGMSVKGNYWETEGLRRKLALVEKPGRKILIVAGSNAYFGVNAQAFAEATGRNAVNLAMQGALPFDFYAELIKDVLQPGDTVVLPLEYAYYGAVHPVIRDRVDFLEASVALTMRPTYLLTRPVGDWLHLLRSLSFKRLWEGATERFRPASERQHRVGEIDAWGDNVADYWTPESQASLRNATKEEASRGLTRFDGDSPSVRSIVRFVDWARRHDVTVVAALPNTLEAPPFAGTDLEELRRRIAGFWGHLGVPLLTVGATISPELILDTPYHTTLEGARLRTRALVGEYCQVVDGCHRAPSDGTRDGNKP